MIPARILGLWAGDRYWRISSIGLSNTKLRLLEEFKKFFVDAGFPTERIKLSVYIPDNFSQNNDFATNLAIESKNVKFYRLKKGPNPTTILYVNSRSLKREFFHALENLESCLKSREDVVKYMAGRFDADGHFDKKKNRIRICYSSEEEAAKDLKIISEFVGVNPKLKYYESAREWVLDFCGKEFEGINNEILGFTISR